MYEFFYTVQPCLTNIIQRRKTKLKQPNSDKNGKNVQDNL